MQGKVGELVEKLGSHSCNCSEVASHCDEVAEIMDGIRAANGQEGKIYEMHKPSFGLEEYENGGSPFLVGVDRQGHCYQLRVSPLVAGGRALLDLASYTVEENTVNMKTAGGQAGAAIALLPSSRATMEDLLAELGFEEEVVVLPPTGPASFPVTGGQLKEIFPNTPQARCDQVAALLNKYSDEYGLTTPERMAHFIGQIGAETQLKNLDEGSYSASRILTAEKTRTTYSSGGKRYLKYCSLFEGYSRASTGCPYPNATLK